jgi:hypothetical protein
MQFSESERKLIIFTLTRLYHNSKVVASIFYHEDTLIFLDLSIQLSLKINSKRLAPGAFMLMRGALFDFSQKLSAGTTYFDKFFAHCFFLTFFCHRFHAFSRSGRAKVKSIADFAQQSDIIECVIKNT